MFVCLFVVDWIAPGPVALNLPRFRPSLASVPGRGGAPSPWPLWPSCAIFLNIKACWACKLAWRGEPKFQWGPGPGLDGWDSITGDQVKLKNVNIQTQFKSCFIFFFAVLAAVPWKVNHDESHLSSSFVFTYFRLAIRESTWRWGWPRANLDREIVPLRMQWDCLTLERWTAQLTRLDKIMRYIT